MLIYSQSDNHNDSPNEQTQIQKPSMRKRNLVPPILYNVRYDLEVEDVCPILRLATHPLALKLCVNTLRRAQSVGEIRRTR